MYHNIINTIKDEFRAIFTDGGAMLLCIFAILIYTLVYSTAYGSEVVRNVSVCIVDNDNTPSSRKLINGLISGPRTKLKYETRTISEAKDLFYKQDVFGIIYIPDDYEHQLISGLQSNVAVILDGSHLLLYKQVLEQVSYDVAYSGASVETARLISNGDNVIEIASTIQPIKLSTTHLYNPSLGYGSFVMPSILIVIIQQTLLIGLALIHARRSQQNTIIEPLSTQKATIITFAKILTYTIIYSINLTFILGIVWPIFGFPFAGKLLDIVILLLLYLIAATALSIALSHLFKRRESPIILLLWSSVPILLLAGVSYPREAFPQIIYLIGRIIPSSSAVDAFISIGTMGASLTEVKAEVATLCALAIIYIIIAIYTQKRCSYNKKIDKGVEYL